MTRLNIIAEPGKQEMIVSRVFNAPRELLFQAYTDPSGIPNWWGPRRYVTTVDQMDVRFGGVWRYVQKGQDGDEHAFRGVYHEILPSERLVYTFEYEGMPGHIGLITVVFEEQGGKTLLTEKSVFQTVEERDGMIQSGMEEGATELFDRLAEIVETAATAAR